jgi:hypothetical protein
MRGAIVRFWHLADALVALGNVRFWRCKLRQNMPRPFWSVSRHQLQTRNEARRITANIAKLLWRSFYIEQSLNHAASAR